MKKYNFFDIVLSDNERKTLISLIKIDHGIPKLIKKPLCEIYKETKIKHRDYQYRISDKLIEKGIVEKDENKKYSIKYIFLDFASSSITQKKIKDLEKIGLFSFLYSTIFGIKNKWLGYPEMHYFNESLVNALSNLYKIKKIKEIFLLRDFSIKWKSFLESDIPFIIKYATWKTIRSKLESGIKKIKMNFWKDKLIY